MWIHSQAPTPSCFQRVWKLNQKTRFWIYICALLCQWSCRKEPSYLSCSSSQQSLQQAAAAQLKTIPKMQTFYCSKNFVEALRYGQGTPESTLKKRHRYIYLVTKRNREDFLAWSITTQHSLAFSKVNGHCIRISILSWLLRQSTKMGTVLF